MACSGSLRGADKGGVVLLRGAANRGKWRRGGAGEQEAEVASFGPRVRARCLAIKASYLTSE